MTLDARARSRLLWRQDTIIRLNHRKHKRFGNSKLHITNNPRVRHNNVPGNRTIRHAVNRNVQEENKNKPRLAITARHLPHFSIQVQNSNQQKNPSTSETRTKPTCKPRKQHRKPFFHAFTKAHSRYCVKKKPRGRGVGCFSLFFNHRSC